MVKIGLKEQHVPLVKIEEPDGIIRMEIKNEDIKKLAESIQAMGLLQAILVRPRKDKFEIVYGHRRFLACKYLGIKSIRATVKAVSDVEAAMMRATENVERVDISPIEEAAVYKDLVETHKLTLEKISKMMGKSVAVVKRRMDLLRMPPCLQQAIHKKEISYSVGEVLWQLGNADQIEYYLDFAIQNGASRNVVNEWVQEELAKRRREGTAGVGGGGWKSPMETRPTYVPCDLCEQALEIGQETVIRACKDCTKVIQEGLKK